MNSAEPHNDTTFFGQYDPKPNLVTQRRIAALMDGLGYDRTPCVTDDEAGVVVVAAVKHLMLPLKDHDHEVPAIRKIVRQNVEVPYYRLRVTDEHVYEPGDFMADE